MTKKSLYPASIQWTCHLAWLSTSAGVLFLCLRPITPHSMALVETLSCQILELLKLLSHLSLVDIYPNALSPKATAEPRLYYVDKIYTYPNLLIVTFVAGLQTFLSNVALTWCNSIPYTDEVYTLTETNSTTTLLYSTFRPQLFTLQHDCFNGSCLLRNNVVINEKFILKEKYLITNICIYFKVGWINK